MANQSYYERAKRYGLVDYEVNSLVPIGLWFAGKKHTRLGSIANSYEPSLSELTSCSLNSKAKFANPVRMQERGLCKAGDHYIAGRRCNWAPTEKAFQIMNDIFDGVEEFIPTWANNKHSGRPLCRDGGEHLHHRKGVLVSKKYFTQVGEHITHARLYPNFGQQVSPDLLLAKDDSYVARVEVVTQHNGYETWRKKFSFWDELDDAPTVWVCENRKHIVQLLNNLIEHEHIILDGGRFGGDPSNWSQKRINGRLRRSGHTDCAITIPSMLEGDTLHTFEFIKQNNISTFA